jgi:hypothetical protein
VAPAAGVSLAVFEEIDGPLEFVSPAGTRDLAPCFIDDQKGAWLKQRIHEPILGPDEGIAMILKFERFKKQQGDFAPTLNHTAQIGGPAQIDSWVQRQWQ